MSTSCPTCDPNMNGEGAHPHINLDELSPVEDCKKIFTPRFYKTIKHNVYVW